jgi:hypothetical protein
MTEPNKTNYLGELLKSSGTITAGAAALAVGGILSIPLGLPGFLIPMITATTGITLAGIFVPGLSGYRSKVDARKRKEARSRIRQHLIDSLVYRAGENHPNWENLTRMEDRISDYFAFKSAASEELPSNDVERLMDAPNSYLSLWATHLSLRERLQTLEKAGLPSRIKTLEGEVKASPGSANLLKALNDLKTLQARRFTLEEKENAVEAAMLSLPDAVDEVTQGAYGATQTEQALGRLRDAVSELTATEEIEQQLQVEMGEFDLDAPSLTAHKINR